MDRQDVPSNRDLTTVNSWCVQINREDDGVVRKTLWTGHGLRPLESRQAAIPENVRLQPLLNPRTGTSFLVTP